MFTIRTVEAHGAPTEDEKMNELKTMTDKALAEHIKELRILENRGFQIGDPSTTGRAIRALEKAWKEQDRRRSL